MCFMPQQNPEAPDQKLDRYGAILFDLDGVITPTADLHREAWADMFSDYLSSQEAKEAAGTTPEPYTDQDYFDYQIGRAHV